MDELILSSTKESPLFQTPSICPSSDARCLQLGVDDNRACLSRVATFHNWRFGKLELGREEVEFPLFNICVPSWPFEFLSDGYRLWWRPGKGRTIPRTVVGISAHQHG